MAKAKPEPVVEPVHEVTPEPAVEPVHEVTPASATSEPREEEPKLRADQKYPHKVLVTSKLREGYNCIQRHFTPEPTTIAFSELKPDQLERLKNCSFLVVRDVVG